MTLRDFLKNHCNDPATCGAYSIKRPTPQSRLKEAHRGPYRKPRNMQRWARKRLKLLGEPHILGRYSRRPLINRSLRIYHPFILWCGGAFPSRVEMHSSSNAEGRNGKFSETAAFNKRHRNAAGLLGGFQSNAGEASFHLNLHAVGLVGVVHKVQRNVGTTLLAIAGYECGQ